MTKSCMGNPDTAGQAAGRRSVCNDGHLSKVEFRTNRRPTSMKIPDSYKGINWDRQIENRKSSTRCKVEHPFLIVKKQFGYAKVAYRGIAKNMNRFHILFASANLVMCQGRTGQGILWGISVPIFKDSHKGMGIQKGIHRVLMPISLQSMPDRVVKGIEQSINQRYR